LHAFPSQSLPRRKHFAGGDEVVLNFEKKNIPVGEISAGAASNNIGEVLTSDTAAVHLRLKIHV
jgi:hypothetical protein